MHYFCELLWVVHWACILRCRLCGRKSSHRYVRARLTKPIWFSSASVRLSGWDSSCWISWLLSFHLACCGAMLPGQDLLGRQIGCSDSLVQNMVHILQVWGSHFFLHADRSHLPHGGLSHQELLLGGRSLGLWTLVSGKYFSYVRLLLNLHIPHILVVVSERWILLDRLLFRWLESLLDSLLLPWLYLGRTYLFPLS